MVAGPDDGHVFHRDEHPADEDEALDAGIARVALAHDDFFDERMPVDLGGWAARDELEKVGEHLTAA